MHISEVSLIGGIALALAMRSIHVGQKANTLTFY